LGKLFIIDDLFVQIYHHLNKYEHRNYHHLNKYE